MKERAPGAPTPYNAGCLAVVQAVRGLPDMLEAPAAARTRSVWLGAGHRGDRPSLD